MAPLLQQRPLAAGVYSHSMAAWSQTSWYSLQFRVMATSHFSYPQFHPSFFLPTWHPLPTVLFSVPLVGCRPSVRVCPLPSTPLYAPSFIRCCVLPPISANPLFSLAAPPLASSDLDAGRSSTRCFRCLLAFDSSQAASRPCTPLLLGA